MKLPFDRLNNAAQAFFDEDQLPSTVWQLANGLYYCGCHVCGKDMEYEGELKDATEDDVFYCGGSPRCCP